MKRVNLAFHGCLFLVARHSQIKFRLKIEPKIRRGSEEASKPECNFRGDGPFFVHDVVDGRGRDVQSQSQLVRIQAQRRHELYPKNFPG